MTKINAVFGFKDHRNWSLLTGVAPRKPYPGLSILNTGSKRANQTVEHSIDYMVAGLNRPLRIATLSAIAGVSESHFFALFKSATGCSPINFFIRLRIYRACELLGHENRRVKETAAHLGYDDPFYFSRIFKSVTGVAPSSYRRLSLESPRAESNCSDVFSRSRPSLSLNSPMTAIANHAL